MNHVTSATLLLLNLGVASIAFSQEIPLKMTFSGSNAATTINLQANTVTDELQAAGNGTLGSFTFRELHADTAVGPPTGGCAGPSFGVVAGAGVFRFQDGSLLIAAVKDGSGCIDLSVGNASLTVEYEIKGGTGRFEGASGNLKMTTTIAAILRNAAGSPAMLTNSGQIEGTLFGRP